jgi:hypothetical protein
MYVLQLKIYHINKTVRPDPAARDNGLSKDERRRSRFDKLSANG